jgi:serine/threonine protein kinase
MWSCPSTQVLRRFGSGLSVDGADPCLDAHINGCAACQAALDRLAHQVSVTRNPGAGWVPKTEDLPRIPGLELERELGRGGMGVVYLATERNTDRAVAVKFPASGPLAAHRDRERWLKEAQAAARVRHPHIVSLYRAEEAGGWLYLVLEYVAGGSLEEHLNGPLPARVAATLLVPIAQALDKLHRAGISHLDLKPRNILVDAAPGTPLDRATLKLTDFGIARSCDEPDPTGSRRGAAPGTLRYMAPEQVAGGRSALGPATDIHAMGVILYELVTGRPPFLADSDVETMQQIQAREPIPPRRLDPKVPRDLETICLKCLEKTPDRRYATAAALAEDLRAFLDGRPISARAVSPIEKTWRWCLRWPAIASLIAVLILSLVSGFAGLFALWRISDAARQRIQVERERVEAERSRAEAERNRAEAELEVSRAALAEIINLSAGGISSPVAIGRTELILSLRNARSRLMDFAARRPDDRAVWSLLAMADLYLGRSLDLEEKLAESLPIHLESLSLWERILQADRDDRTALYNRWRSLVCVASVLERQAKIDESRRFWERALNAGEATLRLVPDYNTMIDCRIGLARAARSGGDPERAFIMLEENLRMWRTMPPAAKSPAQAGRMRGTWDELVLTRWESEQGTDEELARRVVELLHLSPEPGGGGANQVFEAGYSLVRSLAVQASEERRAGQLENARRRAQRLHALAFQLVSEGPDRSAAHLALSEAFRQMAKDAWEVKDLVAMEQNWKQALDEARHAQLCGPHDVRASHEAAVLERRIAEHIASKNHAASRD